MTDGVKAVLLLVQSSLDPVQHCLNILEVGMPSRVDHAIAIHIDVTVKVVSPSHETLPPSPSTEAGPGHPQGTPNRVQMIIPPLREEQRAPGASYRPAMRGGPGWRVWRALGGDV